MEQELSWQPIYKAIQKLSESHDRLSWIVAPFIKLEALKRLLDSVGNTENLVVISRWRIDDFVAGVSDLDIFPYLQQKGIKLFVNYALHMKLYVYESNFAINTSANLTLSGLGYSDTCNIEVANVVKLKSGDWVRLHSIEKGSRIVTQVVYDRYRALLASIPPRLPFSFGGLDEIFGSGKEFTFSSLPATLNPEVLFRIYFEQDLDVAERPETLRRAYHDFAEFGIVAGIETKEEFYRILGLNFSNNPFVREFVIYLNQAKSIHFGGVTSWIHSRCDDVPLPFRWEVKFATQCFYNWLQYFIDEIEWDRPHHSQIIRWIPR